MALINDAARILRIGDKYSETNHKLITAVDEFIEWLYGILGGVNPPYLGHGLRLMRMNDSQIEVEFYVGLDNPETNDVTFHTRSKAPEIIKIVQFCEYLNGLGKNVFDWLEEEAKSRESYLSFLERSKR